MSLRKHIHNSIMVILVALPNLAITLSTVTVLAVVFHWSGWLATLAYLIGQFFSVQWSALFNRGAKGWKVGMTKTMERSKSRVLSMRNME